MRPAMRLELKPSVKAMSTAGMTVLGVSSHHYGRRVGRTVSAMSSALFSDQFETARRLPGSLGNGRGVEHGVEHDDDSGVTHGVGHGVGRRLRSQRTYGALHGRPRGMAGGGKRRSAGERVRQSTWTPTGMHRAEEQIGTSERARQSAYLHGVQQDALRGTERGANPEADRDEMLCALRTLIAPGQVVELRALDVSESTYRQPHTVSGYFNDLEALADAALAVAPYAKNVYITLNPVYSALLARAANRAKPAGKGDPSTGDKDIVVRRWLPLDFDPARPAGISSSEEEHDAALMRAQRVRAFLTEQGWPEPLVADSGNGAHLLYSIDLPAQDNGLVQQVLHALDAQFSDDAVNIDLSVFNPARIWKLYGSVARKGDSIAERPHRLARVLELPDEFEVVSAERLQALAGTLLEHQTTADSTCEPSRDRNVGRDPDMVRRKDGPKNGQKNGRTTYTAHTSSEPVGGSGGTLDVASWLELSGLAVSGPYAWTDQRGQQGRKWLFDVCPFDAAHTNRSAVLLQFASGAVAFRCHHNSCRDHDWQALRAQVEGRESDVLDTGDDAPARVARGAGAGGRLKGHDTEHGRGELVGEEAPGLVLPAGYTASARGLIKESRQRDGALARQVIAYADLLLIKRLVIDITTGTHWLRLAWRQQGIWHETEAERKTVMNARELVSLANVGFPVSSENAAELTKYLCRFEEVNRGQLPVERVTPHLGWQRESTREGNGSNVGERAAMSAQAAGSASGATSGSTSKSTSFSTYLWGRQALGANESIRFRANSGGDDQLADGFRMEGTLEGWLEAVAPVAGYPRVLFGLYAAFTPVLLGILDVPNFVLDWNGRTSTGKTSALRVAASVVGNPDERGESGVIASWDTTKVAIERRCATCTDLPVFLDDTKRVKKTDMVGEVLYEVTNGRGRDRGSIAGRDRTVTWRTVVFSTGEAPVTSFTNDGGTRGRVLPLTGMPFESERAGEVVRRVNAGVCRHYGHGLPVFVRWVQAHSEEWEAWKEQYRRAREALESENAVAGRLAAYFAAVTSTAELVHRAFADAGYALPWQADFGVLWQAIVRETDTANVDVRALRDVFSWAQQHEGQFYGRHSASDREPNGGWAGCWSSKECWDAISFLPSVLDGCLRQLGYHPADVSAGWRERGWLRVEADGKSPKVTWQRDNRRTRMATLLRTGFMEIGEVDQPLTTPAGGDPTFAHVTDAQMYLLLRFGETWEQAAQMTREQATRMLGWYASGTIAPPSARRAERPFFVYPPGEQATEEEVERAAA